MIVPVSFSATAFFPAAIASSFEISVATEMIALVFPLGRPRDRRRKPFPKETVESGHGQQRSGRDSDESND